MVRVLVMTLQNESKFDLEKFLTPDGKYAPVYIWVWNSPCTKEIIDEQLSEMERLGIRAFYILPEPKEFRPNSMPTDLTPGYMTEEFLALYAYALERGKARGMNCWIYDEGGWPSGGACGIVLRDHPEFARQVLSSREVSFESGSKYSAPCGNFLSAFTETNEQIFDGAVFEKDTVVTEYYIERQNYGGSDYPDLLNRDATDYFINVTHEKYASVLGELCGNGVGAVFTDEPKAPLNPMNKELIERYEREYGESVLPYLPLLAGKISPTEENCHILRRWYDLCSRVFCENFLLPCKEWTNRHGMAFTGHLDRDHDPMGCVWGGGHFNLCRALRCLDIPGVDIIWRQIYPDAWSDVRDDVNGYNGFFPRYASSAARQIGTEFAMSESFGVLGPGASYGVMRYILGFQAVRGINIFNFFDFSMGRSGAFLSQELPVFTEDQIYYRDLSLFNTYVERLAYLASLGRRVCETGLYYPVNDFWAGVNAEKMAKAYDGIGRALEDRFVDFDILDDDIIADAVLTEDGYLAVGNAAYKNIVIPKDSFIPPKTAEILEKFVLSGGRIFNSAGELEPEIEVVGNCGGLRACRRKIENGELWLLFREGGDSGEYGIAVPNGKTAVLSPESGKLKKLSAQNGVLKISLELGETAVVLVGDGELPDGDEPVFSREREVETAFTFYKEREQTCTDRGFETVFGTDGPEPIALGSWTSVCGEEFSGSGVYETEFELSGEFAGERCELDLGKVCYTAYAELNGVDLGKVLAPPYRFDVPSGVLKEKNRLKITVVNTVANWYTHTHYFDRWEKRELSPYFEGELAYAAEYAGGGLYGPVKLCFE